MEQSGAVEATLSEHAFNQLRSIIRERVGIQFPDEKRYLLESRARPRLIACDCSSFEEYVRYLQREHDPKEITRLLNAVTINETSFFRHPAQFDALEEVILPKAVERRREDGSSTVRLWSAACSAGDEAYSLAILVKERIKPQFPQMEFQIVGTDVNTEVLEEARSGHYRRRATRNVPTAYLHKYFRRMDDIFVLHSSVREMVSFKALNLVDAQDMRRMRDFDVIMCANVLIYFDQNQKENVLHSLHRSLRPGGYLFVGGSEALGDAAERFESLKKKDALVYRRPRTVSASSRT